MTRALTSTPAAHSAKGRAARPLRSFLLGSALFWPLWGAVSIGSDSWFWWPVALLAGWTGLLALYVWIDRVPPASPRHVAAAPESAGGPARAAALLLIAGLAAGPVGTHVYWLLGGTWGLYTNGVRDEVASTGVRVLAAVVIVLLVLAVLVVLARAGLWQQRLLSDRIVRLLAWALAAVFVLETLAGFTWSRGEPQWWLYGPVSLVLAVLALVVAGSGGAWRIQRRHRSAPLPSS